MYKKLKEPRHEKTSFTLYANNACAFAQSDQRRCCSLLKHYISYTCYIQHFKTLASFCTRATLFESYLVANLLRQVFSWHGSKCFTSWLPKLCLGEVQGESLILTMSKMPLRGRIQFSSGACMTPYSCIPTRFSGIFIRSGYFRLIPGGVRRLWSCDLPNVQWYWATSRQNLYHFAYC